MKNKKRSIIFALLLTLAVPITAFAYTYAGISLPALSGNWESPNRTKTTYDDWFSHRLTNMGGDYTYVNVWLTHGLLGDVTSKVKHHLGDASQKVYYNNSANAYPMDGFYLVLENSSFTYVAVEAAGEYDIR